VGHACKVGLGMRGPEETSGWLRNAVERVRGGQGWFLALEGSLVVSYARFGQYEYGH
jgi:hypothetical protein